MTDVEQLLRDKEIYYIPKGKDLLVKCFNPEHDDSSPSMRIDREEGVYHCLSCGHKGNVFAEFNRYRRVFNSKVSAIKDKIRRIHTEASGVPIPSDAFAFYRPERGLKAETFKRLGAFTSESKDWEHRIVIPIVDYSGKVRGFNGRYMLTNPGPEIPKYMVKPDGVDLPLFPPITAEHTSLILVEGLFDALNLHDKGLTNAVCTFGTQRLSAHLIYEKLLPYMIRGVNKIFILFDGDEAGREAAKKVREMIVMKTDLLAEIVNLKDGQDPGGLSLDEVENLKKVFD